MISIQKSTDAGAYYCGHIFFAADQYCRANQIALDQFGTPRVGFLHIPRDEACVNGKHDFQDFAKVLLRGLRRLPLGYRVLLTGFGPFGDVASNPTGALFSRSEELLALLRPVFARARALPSSDGVVIDTGTNLLTFVTLPVDDRALDPSDAQSITAHIKRLRPDFVWMNGVGKAGFAVETQLDDRGLSACAHDESPATMTRENLTLWRLLCP